MKDSKVEIKAVVVATISMCTKNCWHCKFGVLSAQPPQLMPDKFVIKIIDDLAFIDYKKRLSLFNGNEPLLDPRLPDFYRYARKKLPDVPLTLVSNGDLATPEVLKRLFDSGLQKITFSLHQGSREEELVSYQKQFGKDKIVIADHVNQAHFHNRGGLIKSNKVSQKRYPTTGCSLPFKQLNVYTDYTMGLCSADQAENFKVEIGDKPIWQVFFENENLNRFRNMMAGDKRDIFPCAECSYEGKDYF